MNGAKQGVLLPTHSLFSVYINELINIPPVYVQYIGRSILDDKLPNLHNNIQ